MSQCSNFPPPVDRRNRSCDFGVEQPLTRRHDNVIADGERRLKYGFREKQPMNSTHRVEFDANEVSVGVFHRLGYI